MRTPLRLVMGAIATAAIVWFVLGTRVVTESDQQYALTLLGVTAIMRVVDAVIKPFTQALSFCLVLLTFGLSLPVINTVMLLLTAWVAQKFGIGFFVDEFWPTLWESIVISIASPLLSGALGAEKA